MFFFQKKFYLNAVEAIQTIDIEKLIAYKNPRLLRYIPRFVLRYLKRILHQDEVNYVLTTYRTSGLEFLRDLIRHLNITYSVQGLERLQQGQRYLFVCNHPLGALDGVIIMSAIGNVFPNIKFPVNDFLLLLQPLQPLFLPINKHGAQPAEAVRQLRERLSSDDQVLYFPAGICSRKIGGKITDLPWKKSFIKMAVEHKRSVVPMFFDGRNSSFFYGLASWRKRLGIKANLEMLYLSDELFRQRNSRFTLRVGEAIPHETFTKERKTAGWVDFVRQKTYALGES
ncbi:MAG: 1-acyl-sn-glycerol-3-phosphate acyltransferase [Prevotellaceae bacterium]|nr:1-acyl-sn-glycerol-3-phosphate acyltransferase [Prevotellaceae bacterium]